MTNRRFCRVWLIAVAAMLGLLAPTGLLAASAHAADSSGHDCDGILLVIDDGTSAETTCVTIEHGSGFEVLNAAGVNYTFVRGVPGFVCTINGTPDPCNGAPVQAYWSYWQAEPDGPWVCATEGAATTAVAAPAVEGWAFGAGATPPRLDDRDVASTCRGGSTAAADATSTGSEPVASQQTGNIALLGLLAAGFVILVAVGVVRLRAQGSEPGGPL